ncbi:MAG: outer membrane beta-barrel protein [Dysgonamonadaceae bacterium]|nr:outer membrane beta-barrel protein [Dysgonamonadaceae bacterium]
MKKLFIILSASLIFSFFANAQSSSESGSISGKLIDDISKEPISEANIRILAQKDSTYITGKASGKDGSFSIPIKNGNYIVHVSYVGYAEVYKDAEVSNSSSNVRLGTISMQDDNLLLDEATVTAKAVEIVVRGDTIEYNADSYKVTESAVIEDLLKKMPGVEIDKDGKITVNGRDIKKILVDGKEFFSDDPKVASKNLPAKMVDKLQVLERRTDMSMMTGFDDGDEETVINLTVKPGMKEGVFGNAFAGYGSQDRYEANAMVNYMREGDQLTFLGGLNNTNNAGFSDLASAMFGSMGGGRRGRGGWGGSSGITKSASGGLNFSKEFSEKLTLGGNVRYGDTDTDNISKVYTQNLLSSGNTFERETNQSNNYSQNINMDFRMEWTPDTLTKFIFRPNASFYNNNRTETGEFSTINAETDTINYGNSDYYSEGTGKNIGGTLEGSRQLGKNGRVISFSIGGGISDSENTGTNLSNTFYSTRPDDIINQRFTNTNSSHNMRAYASYVEPLGNNNFLQLAYNYRFNYSESDKDTRTKDDNNQYTILDTTYSKRLENNFYNQNVELNFRSSREKYNYMFGVSMQPSKSASQTFIGDSLINDFTQNVINFAPMAQFNYMWSRQNNLRINYNGSTNQPSVTQLSSVVDVSDPLNISYGNPNLKPAFNHNMRIRYRMFDPEKNRSYMFMTNAGFSVNDIVSYRITDKETGKKESTYENVNGNWNANARFMTNQPLGNIKFTAFSMTFVSYNNSNGFSNGEKNTSKRLNLGETLGVNYRSDLFDLSARGNVSYSKVDNTLPGQQNQEYFNYGGGAQTTIYLPFDFLIESDINYSTNSGYADGFEQKELLWNAALSKQLFKQKNGTIRFKIYDILKQKSDISRSVTSNYIRDTTTNTLTSYFMFHFVYRFNIFKGGRGGEDTERGGLGLGMGRGQGRGRGPH